MNDFQNNQDNMNDSYDQGYGQENSGGYSYNYTPNGQNRKKQKNKKVKRFLLISLMSALLIMAVILSGFAMGTLAVKNWRGTSDNGSDSGSPSLSQGGTQSGSQGGVTEGSEGGSQGGTTDGNVVIYKQNPQQSSNLTSAGQAFNSYTEVYNAVSDCVVEITTETVQNSTFMGQYVSTGAGSGVIISESGYIVTNNHVIEDARNIKVTLKSGESYTATLVGTDETSDIAVIRIEPESKELSVAVLGCSEDVKVGEYVVAIGNPLGSLGGTMTEGIISATERQISIDGESMTLLQTSAAINPGNSGGGLFNMKGELVGIVNAKASGEDIEGLGFAIPVDTAYTVICDLVQYGYVRGVPDCGLSTIDITAQNLYTFYRYGITSTGVMIYESKYSDELKSGDMIVSVNGISVSSSSEVESIIQACSVGDSVTFTVQRSNKTVNVSLTLRERVPDYINFG